MNYDKIESELATIDRHLHQSKIKLAPGAEVVGQMDLVREFLRDKAQLNEKDLCAKWDPQFKSFYDAQLAVGLLGGAVTELLARKQPQLDKYLRVILAGGITQGGDPEQARDFLYELWLASQLSIAGFTVALQEPDLVVEGNGLGQPLGIACKYPSSTKQIHSHLSKGISQLAKQGIPGFVALGVDQIVIAEMNLNKYVDFNQGTRHPVLVLEDKAAMMSKQILKERPTKFPSEADVNELLVTLSINGIYGHPAGFTLASAAVIHCTDECLILPDMRIIYEKLPTFPKP